MPWLFTVRIYENSNVPFIKSKTGNFSDKNNYRPIALV